MLIDFSTLSYKSKLFSGLHLIQTLLFCAYVALSYLLMLVFMTFSVWLGLAVCAGAATGFFVFGARPINLAATNNSELRDAVLVNHSTINHA